MNPIVKVPQDERKLKGSELLILDAALHSFLKFGYRGTTMKKIAEFAGKSKASVYYHYRSKDDLFEIVFCHYINMMLDTVKNHEPIDMEIRFEQRMIEYPEIYSIAWFVANEFQTNARLAFGIMNRNEKLKKEFNAVYENNNLQEKFERLIRVNLNVIIQKCRARIEA